MYLVNTNQKKAGVTLSVSGKVDFTVNKQTKKLPEIKKKGYYLLVKWTVNEEDTAILNVYVLNNSALKSIKI